MLRYRKHFRTANVSNYPPSYSSILAQWKNTTATDTQKPQWPPPPPPRWRRRQPEWAPCWSTFCWQKKKWKKTQKETPSRKQKPKFLHRNNNDNNQNNHDNQLAFSSEPYVVAWLANHRILAIGNDVVLNIWLKCVCVCFSITFSYAVSNNEWVICWNLRVFVFDFFFRQTDG